MSLPPFEDYPDIAKTDEEAANRFERAMELDPFPEIAPSLLNFADIYDYVRMTGMLYAFDPDPKKLKSASYEAAIGRRCIWWDEEGEQREVQLQSVSINSAKLTGRPDLKTKGTAKRWKGTAVTRRDGILRADLDCLAWSRCAGFITEMRSFPWLKHSRPGSSH